MTAALPLALAYEAPDRDKPWAQALMARLEAVARQARVPLVARVDDLDIRAKRLICVLTREHVFERTVDNHQRHEKTEVVTIALDGTVAPDGVVLVPLETSTELERVMALADLAALMLEVHRIGDPDHPLVRLAPGVHRVALGAQPELVSDLAGTSARLTLARLAARLRAQLEPREPLVFPASELVSTTATPDAPTRTDDPLLALKARADSLELRAREALDEVDRLIEHSLRTHGLGAVLPLLDHLGRLANELPRSVARPPQGDPEHELAAAQHALERAKAVAMAVPRPLPRTFSLVMAHGPVVAALGGVALAPLTVHLLPSDLAANLSPAGGAWALSGLLAVGLFGLGTALAGLGQALARTRAQRRLDEARLDLEHARARRLETTLTTHEPELEARARKRVAEGLASRRARLEPIARRIQALSTAHPKPSVVDPWVEVLAPPIEPWVLAIQEELARGEYHPPTLVALDERVAAGVADHARWQERADLCARLVSPALDRLGSMAEELCRRVPRSAPARRLALRPSSLSTPKGPESLAGFELCASIDGLYTLALFAPEGGLR